MKAAQFNQHSSHTIHLAFREDRLQTLIAEGKLHAADFNCLDKPSKRTVWSMLLAAAARRMS
ncbi:hypothetical protein [Methylophaga sp. OBS1]|jgi:hypothetical protein|uniref:hypothetical protein n=1 Tax=Methylophaga sp. OBS1 TaxID=2991933 RepID=UPI00225632B7|nr:hypothetical protein [Methylophaga sp. OBS1]MCX4193640.1 hypothetical protein [Methylophaga sp. OBS1]